MSKCQCCGYSGKARVEYLELLRPLRRRIANQRKELTRLLAIEAAWLAEGMAKAEMQFAEMKRAAQETRSVPTVTTIEKCDNCGVLTNDPRHMCKQV